MKKKSLRQKRKEIIEGKRNKQQPISTEREQQIYQWKTLGKGLSWSRWCALMGYRVKGRKK